MDWINTFLEYSALRPSPEIFKLWSAITAISGAMERRVSLVNNAGELFPNLFVMLVAPPAVGKTQAILPTKDLWLATKKIKVAPSSTTKASLLDELERAAVKLPINGGAGLLEYHALAIPSTEFSNFLTAYDHDFLAVLIQIFDAEPFPFVETRRHSRGGKPINLTNPIMTMICATQPAYLSYLLPDEAWGGGFMSRVLMIYSGSGPEHDLWSAPSISLLPLRAHLLNYMMQLTTLRGNFTVTPEALAAIKQWQKDKLEPRPTHSKLMHYNARRMLLYLKLCMVASLSEGLGLIIDLTHAERAKGWLLQAEEQMPDVFREMASKNDSLLIQELHRHVWGLWLKSAKRPVHESRLYHFLQERTTADRASKILEIACKSNIIQKVAGEERLFIPRTKTDWGIE